MGCYTIYVVRELDGSVRANGSRGGRYEFASADELLAHLDTLPWWPAEDEGPLDAAWCCGWFVDRRRRFARWYPCHELRYAPFVRERRMRVEAGWHGWDIGLAGEKNFEVSELAGLPVADDQHFADLDGFRGCAEGGLLTYEIDPAHPRHLWDAAAEELWLEPYYMDHCGVDVTVIDAEGRVRDYAFEQWSAPFEALGLGPRLLDVLRDAAHGPAAITTNAGAVIDVQERTVRYRLENSVAPATVAELRRRWPGFTIERERADLAGHLQRTGRAEQVRTWGHWTEPELPYPPADPPRVLRFIKAWTVDVAELAPSPR